MYAYNFSLWKTKSQFKGVCLCKQMIMSRGLECCLLSGMYRSCLKDCDLNMFGKSWGEILFHCKTAVN